MNKKEKNPPSKTKDEHADSMSLVRPGVLREYTYHDDPEPVRLEFWQNRDWWSVTELAYILKMFEPGQDFLTPRGGDSSDYRAFYRSFEQHLKDFRAWEQDIKRELISRDRRNTFV